MILINTTLRCVSVPNADNDLYDFDIYGTKHLVVCTVCKWMAPFGEAPIEGLINGDFGRTNCPYCDKKIDVIVFPVPAVINQADCYFDNKIGWDIVNSNTQIYQALLYHLDGENNIKYWLNLPDTS